MATRARIAGTVKVDGLPAARKVLVISDSSSPVVLASGTSAANGSFEIEYANWTGAVVAISLDEYGQKFTPLTALLVGAVIHPSTPNGYVYTVTVEGTTGASEPTWTTSGTVQTGSVTLAAKPYYRPIASGPVQGDVLESTPPTPTDEYFQNVVALLHFNGVNNSTVFTDQRGASWTKSGDVVISTAKSKFGGSSAKFNGGMIYAARTDFTLTPNSLLTVEFWASFSSVSGAPHLFVLGSTEDNRVTLYVAAGRLLFWSKTSFGNYGVRITGPLVITGIDYFIALTKSGDVWELFVDGVSYGVSNTVIYPKNASPQVALGAFPFTPSPADQLYGHIDDFRMTTWVNRFKNGCTVPAAQFPDQGLS